MKKKNRIKIVILMMFSVIQIFPLLWLVNFSLKDNSEIYTVSSLKLPETPMLGNYVEAWLKGNVAEYFMNSVLVTFISVAVTVVLSCMMGYAITRMKCRIGIPDAGDDGSHTCNTDPSVFDHAESRAFEYTLVYYYSIHSGRSAPCGIYHQ